MVNHSSKKTTINCVLTDPVFGEFAEPYLEILEDLSAGTMLYCDYGEEYWKGREHEIVEDAPEEEDGTSITLTLTHDLYDSFSGRTPLIEVRAANKYWDRRIGKHAGTLSTAVIARAYGKGRQTQQYAVERVARISKAELVALSELHRGWVEEQGNDHPFYYVLFLS